MPIDLAPNIGIDRESISMVGGGTLAAASTATLRCTAPVTTGNSIASGLTAIRVATLN